MPDEGLLKADFPPPPELTCRRVRINCISILDVISPDVGKQHLPQHQQEDLLSLGKLFLSLATHSLTAIHSIPQSMDQMTRRSNYSQELSNAILYLLSKPSAGRKSIDEFLGLIAGRMADELAGGFE